MLVKNEFDPKILADLLFVDFCRLVMPVVGINPVVMMRLGPA
jgi:hypothetical protein